MSKKMRFLIGVLVASMLLSLLAGCKNSSTSNSEHTSNNGITDTQEKVPEYLNAEGFPIVSQPITLKVMVSKHPAQPDWEEIMVWQEYEKMTGVKIEWINVPSANISEKRNLALASGDLPDIFYKTSIPDSDILKYGEQGTFMKLNDLIDKYAPNYKLLEETMPDVKKSIPTYDGSVYALPSLLDIEPAEIQRKLFLNRKWLNEVGMEMPTTIDELYKVFKAFKEQDPNKNGKADEIPYSSVGLTYLMDGLKGAWGLGNRGITHKYVDMDEKTGKLRFLPVEPAFREMLEYMNKLYSEGLIDQEIFTADSTQQFAKFEANTIGSFVNTGNTSSKYGNDYEGLGEALEGPHGDKLWAGRRSHIAAKGAFAITSVNKYPDVSMRWVDYFYSDEGSKLYYVGIEGKTCRKTDDGRYVFMDEIVNNIPEGMSISQVKGKYVPYGGGGGPTVTKPQYFDGGEMEAVAFKACQNMSQYTPKEIWGPFSYTAEENESLMTLETDILTYVNQSIAKFVMGQTSLTEWDAYVEQIKRMGLDEYMKIYTAAYERYK